MPARWWSGSCRRLTLGFDDPRLKTLRIETPQKFLPLIKPARYKCAHGGRGSGKSHFFAERLSER